MVAELKIGNCSECPLCVLPLSPDPKEHGGEGEERKEAFCFEAAEQEKEMAWNPQKRDCDEPQHLLARSDLLLIHELQSGEALTLILTLTLICPWGRV